MSWLVLAILLIVLLGSLLALAEGSISRISAVHAKALREQGFSRHRWGVSAFNPTLDSHCKGSAAWWRA